MRASRMNLRYTKLLLVVTTSHIHSNDNATNLLKFLYDHLESIIFEIIKTESKKKVTFSKVHQY